MKKHNSAKFNQILGWGVAATIAFAIIGGLMMVGSPMQARDFKLDAKRLSNMQSTARVISCYADKRGLPETLTPIKAALEDGLKYDSKEQRCRYLKWQTDPLTEVDFAYRRVSDTSFELCGVFARKQDIRQAGGAVIYGTNKKAVLNTTTPRAAAGRHCYRATGWN